MQASSFCSAGLFVVLPKRQGVAMKKQGTYIYFIGFEALNYHTYVVCPFGTGSHMAFGIIFSVSISLLVIMTILHARLCYL